MSRILHVRASPMGEPSFSSRLAAAFLDAYCAAHPSDRVDTRDLWHEPPPEFDRVAAAGKYKIMAGAAPTGDEARAWDRVRDEIDRFTAADKVVVSAPMWNFGVPYRLKHWLDVVVQPSLTFGFDPAAGYSGLVTGRPLLLVLARGGTYPAGTDAAGLDHQRPYLEQVFGFMGFTAIHTVVVEPTLQGGPDAAEAALARAAETVRDLARTF